MAFRQRDDDNFNYGTPMFGATDTDFGQNNRGDPSRVGRFFTGAQARAAGMPTHLVDEYEAAVKALQASPLAAGFGGRGTPEQQKRFAELQQIGLDYIDPNRGYDHGIMEKVVKGGLLAATGYVGGGAMGLWGAPAAGAAGAAGAATGSSLFPAVAPVAGAPTALSGGALGTTSLGGGALTSVAPEFAAWSAGAGGLGATEGVAGGGSWLTDAVGGESPIDMSYASSSAPESASWTAGADVGGPGEALTGATGNLGSSLSLSDAGKFIKEWGPLASSAFGLYGSIGAAGRANDEEARLRAAFDRSDPFAEARKSAGDQYLEWQQDPSKYMSSPIARLQIDEMNREAQRKNAMLGQTWNVDNAGNIRGSGTGANEFAKQLQFNLTRQYEQALGNRAQQAGMSLFPNAEISRQLSQNAASQQGVQRDIYGNIIGLAGSLGDLYSSGKMNDLYSKFFGA